MAVLDPPPTPYKIMKITTQQLEKIYLENTNKKACEILGIVNSTLTIHLRKRGIKLKLRERAIKLKGSNNRNKRNNENNK
jgi:hypothetical protein